MTTKRFQKELFTRLYRLGWIVGVALIFWLEAVGVPAAETPSPRSMEATKGNKDAQPELPSAGHEEPKKVEKGDASQIKGRGIRKRLPKTPTPGGPVPILCPNTSGKEAVQ